MKAVQIKPFQQKAIDSIAKALELGKKHIVLEMPAGCGKSIILAETINRLILNNTSTVLIVTNSVSEKKQMEDFIYTNYKEFIHVSESNIKIENEQKLLHNRGNSIDSYQYIVFFETIMSQKIYETLKVYEKTTIVFSTYNSKRSNKLFDLGDVIFSYSYKQAIMDGVITPAMDPQAFNPAVEIFCDQLLQQFGYVINDSYANEKNGVWDLCFTNLGRRIYVECKTYKSEIVSVSAANSLLNTILMHKKSQRIARPDIIVLIVFSKIPSFQKDVIYRKYGIVVLDIENLVFYASQNASLLKQLSQITYFSIDGIKGQVSKELNEANILTTSVEDDEIEIVEETKTKTKELIKRLKSCEPGNNDFSKYETVCEEIIRTLFEVNFFNRFIKQFKTKDGHFRMDMIGSLKTTVNNQKDMNTFLQILIQHYNTRFVVFEFKNYAEKLDQNVIYITEKYLYNAALRNVPIIVSRNGFSESAKFAAEGCLKENGKLILSISDEELIDMLKAKDNGDEPMDLLLVKLEDLLMGISK